MEQAAAGQEYERAARYRDLISTVEQLQERQRIAAAEGDDADVFGYHYENGMLAVNLFHMRGGKMVDRREFFWEDLPEFASIENVESMSNRVGADAFVRPGEQSSPAQLASGTEGLDARLRPRCARGRTKRPSLHEQQRSEPSFHPGEFFSALLKQIYIGQPYVPRNLYVRSGSKTRAELEDLLSEQMSNGIGRGNARAHSRSAARGKAVTDRSRREPTPNSPTISAFAC